LFNKQDAEDHDLHRNYEENINNNHRLNNENYMQDLLNFETPLRSREDMLLQSLEGKQTSYTFYSTNCLSNSERSLYNFNDRDSLSFNLDNNYNTNFFNNNMNNDSSNLNSNSNNYYSFNSNCKSNFNYNCANNDEYNCNMLSPGKNLKSNQNMVGNINSVFCSMEKEQEQEQVAYEENSNTNALNNSGFTMNCRITEDKEPKKGFVRFDIPFQNLKENNFEASLKIISEKHNEININNNYNLDQKKHKNNEKELKESYDYNNYEMDNKEKKRLKHSKKKIDIFKKKLESGIINTISLFN